jgi:hypothetical protein
VLFVEDEPDEMPLWEKAIGACGFGDLIAGRIERAENDLARARADLAAAKTKPRTQTARDDARFGPILEHLNRLELELGQAVAENELRRGRMLPPNEREVLTVRQDAAREVRQLQSIRPLPWPED